MSPTAALRINVKPYEHVVIEPQEIDGTGHDYAVIVTGHGPATVRLDGVVVRGSRSGLAGVTAGCVEVHGGEFHCTGGAGLTLASFPSSLGPNTPEDRP